MLKVLLNIVLFPFALIYGSIVTCRNFLFNISVLKQTSFETPVVSVGNITVGGTGKTPHVEYLINVFKDYNIAVLSRGYKRKTNGFQIASGNSTSEEIGDEPKQIQEKFPNITVAVDKDRVNGISQLIKLKDPDIILLDDAYQHRYVKPKTNILLVDYNRPLYNDCTFPVGRLREPSFGKNRADIIIVTKCPANFSVEKKDRFLRMLKPSTYQKVFFSTYTYGDFTSVFDGAQMNHNKIEEVLAFAGIAKPKPFFDYLDQYFKVTSVSFPDHHFFTTKDIEEIKAKFDLLSSQDKIIITTEKDAVRLRNLQLDDDLKKVMIYIPINVGILLNEQAEFENTLFKNVRKN